MRRNENTVLIGERILLVPYGYEHVEKYHEWMKDSYLQGECVMRNPIVYSFLREGEKVNKEKYKRRYMYTFSYISRLYHFLEYYMDPSRVYYVSNIMSEKKV